MRRRGFLAGVALTAVVTSCSEDKPAAPTPAARPTTPTATPTAAPHPSASATPKRLPGRITAIMSKPRYAKARWTLLVTDVETGAAHYELNADEMAFTGSTRKLFSVGTALDTLGPDYREHTPVHRTGSVDRHGRLHGDLVLVGGGDLTFGGRRIGADGVQYTDFDHNERTLGLGPSALVTRTPSTRQSSRHRIPCTACTSWPGRCGHRASPPSAATWSSTTACSRPTGCPTATC